MIAWLAPGALALAVLGGLPWLVHWLTRRQRRRQPFPALAFLLRADGGRTRRHRIRDWLALICRCLALLALVAAAAGPLWQGALVGGDRRPAVIILDASASMRQRSDQGSAWAQARAAADRLVDRLAPRPVLVLIADTPVRRSGPAPATDISLARSTIAEAQPGFGDGDASAAVAAAVAALPEGGDIFFLTDGARSSLAGIDPGAFAEGLAFQAVLVAGGGGNRAVTALHSRPSAPVAGSPFTVEAEVVNWSDEPAELRVQLAVGPEQHVAALELAPGGRGSVAHSLTMDAAGHHRVHARLLGDGDDHLAADDERSGAATIHVERPVWVVSDRHPDETHGPTRPVMAALHASGWSPRYVETVALRAAEPGTAWVVTVGLDEDAGIGDWLAEHLHAGGDLLQIVDDAGDAALDVGGIRAPLRLGELLDFAVQEPGYLNLAPPEERAGHPFAELFAGRAGLLLQQRSYRIASATASDLAPDAEGLLAYQDGSVAVARRPVGSATWWTVNIPPSALASNLAEHELLPLLLEDIARTLRSGEGALTRAVGERIASDQALTGPDEQPRSPEQGQLLLDQPGWYRFPGGRLVAAGIPSSESDLRQPGGAGLRRQGMAVAAAEAALDAARRKPLWPWLLLIGLVLIAIELGLLRSVARRGAA